jgi:two-component system chemotaxis response regulator CheB
MRSRQRRWLRYEVLVIGSSWGGIEALTELVGALPASFPLAVIIVQHQHPHSRNALAGILGRAGVLPVSDIEDKDEMLPGHIYLAPANYHLLLERDRCFSLSLDAHVQFCRPSVDVSFSSVAAALGPRAMGLILTGANDDGAEGLRRIKLAGGYTMAQEPDGAVAPAMPRAAIATGCVDTILRVEQMIPHILNVLGPVNTIYN